MDKVTCAVLFVLLAFTTAVFAEVGPVAPAPEDVSFGYCDPIIGNWATDMVTWTQMANATATFRRAASAAIGNYWYCFGDQTVATSHAFNLTTHQWELSTPPLIGTCNWTGLAINGQFYIIGRYNPGYGNEIQRFTPTAGGPTGTWEYLAPYPIAACGVGAAWDGGDYIYAGGGNPSPTSAYKYSISQNAWTQIANIPVSMAYTGGAFANGKFYLMGGTTSPACTSLYEYDPATNTWTLRSTVPNAVWFATFSVSNNADRTLIYSIGGGGGYGSWPATNAVQIYDPALDLWTQETPLPAAYGTNAADYIENGIGMSAGGYDGVTNHAETFQGVGFPTGATTPPNITIAMVPVGGPIVIPPGGGSFSFDATITNNEASAQTFQVWIMVTLPNGNPYGPVLGPIALTLPAGLSITRNRSQTVPAGAPPGNYTYTGNVGSYPATIYDSDSFPFTKATLGDGALVGEWSNSGESFESGVSAAVPLECALLGNYPNPFNPSTTIQYALNTSGRVSLTVHDVAGRTVATLVNGYRDAGNHEVTFDASGLTSGVYLCKLTSDAKTVTLKMVLMK
jgi:hypothetical protein